MWPVLQSFKLFLGEAACSNYIPHKRACFFVYSNISEIDLNNNNNKFFVALFIRQTAEEVILPCQLQPGIRREQLCVQGPLVFTRLVIQYPSCLVEDYFV